MLLTRITPTAGRRIGVFSLPGGGTGLVADLAADYGFTVPDLAPETIAELKGILPDIAIPKNPLDPTAGFGRDSEKLRAALKAFSADPNVDILVFFPLASQVDYSLKLAEDLVAVKDDIGKPIVAIWTAGRQLEPGAWRTLHQAGIPLFVQTGAAFRALARVRQYAEYQAGRADPASRDFGPRLGQPAQVQATPDAASLRAELARFGIRLPRTQLATSAAEAANMVPAMGGTMAMKIASPDIPHKTEAGGVRLGIASAEGARKAFEAIVASARAHNPAALIEGVEVQEMVPEGVEILLGLSTDDQLGPILTVGLGGVMTEVLRDVSQRPVPVSRAEARRMLAELRGARTLQGFRGHPPADVEALLDTMLGLSALGVAWAELHPEVDLNPVVVLERGKGAIAVDALARLHPVP
jgi:acyl-CoA synthetase (NDP forming)